MSMQRDFARVPANRSMSKGQVEQAEPLQTRVHAGEMQWCAIAALEPVLVEKRCQRRLSEPRLPEDAEQ